MDMDINIDVVNNKVIDKVIGVVLEKLKLTSQKKTKKNLVIRSVRIIRLFVERERDRER